MGGRLSTPIDNKIQSFPINSWEQEFKYAKQIGFDCMEWVFDTLQPNPIITEECKNIQKNCQSTNLEINSVCADYFMEKLLFGVDQISLEKNLLILKKLISNCQKIEIPIIEIPLVDSSSIKNKEKRIEFVNNLIPICEFADKNNIILSIETDLPPFQFKEFLKNFDQNVVKANYDVGNSISNGYDVEEELEILGSFIANIHVKDRLIGGGTVTLGYGDVNFSKFFSALKKINYRGDFIIQGAREDGINPKTTSEKYLKFVKQYTHKYLI
jgi:L-ribulose-5-phosphate 3-epimerase